MSIQSIIQDTKFFTVDRQCTDDVRVRCFTNKPKQEDENWQGQIIQVAYSNKLGHYWNSTLFSQSHSIILNDYTLTQSPAEAFFGMRCSYCGKPLLDERTGKLHALPCSPLEKIKRFIHGFLNQ